MERPLCRAGAVLQRRVAARRQCLFHFPHHGGHRPASHSHGGVGRVALVEGQPVHQQALPAGLLTGLAARLHRHSGRLVRHRTGPPALAGIRPSAHPRRHLARTGSQRGGHAGPLRLHLRHHLRDGDLLHKPPHRARPLARSQSETVRPAEPPAFRRRGGHARSPGPRTRSAGLFPAGDEAMTETITAMEWYLPVIWASLIGLAVMMYVILDGFDLGIGILFPFTRQEEERDVMMNSVAPFWDGNETWLVLGGGGLWVAFPTAYAVIMPAFYLPVLGMLLALVLRGVSFEFRWVAKPSHLMWDVAFAGGSIVAAFLQGTILGGLLQGVEVVNRQYAGGPFDWLTPFSIFVGLAVVAGYALLGATWLVMRTEGPAQEFG